MKYPLSGITGFILLAGLSATAQTWNGTVSNDWNTAANWTPASVPGTGATVTINSSAVNYFPQLKNNVSIGSLNLSAGLLDLNANTLSCSGNCLLIGDSLRNGKITANNFTNVANMHLGAQVSLEKTGAANAFWDGNNKFYGDSLIITWRTGTLHMESASPDSIFGQFKIILADNYGVNLAYSKDLYIGNNLILDNIGSGNFSWNNSQGTTTIEGRLITYNFSYQDNITLKNIRSLGTGNNGPIYALAGTIDHCRFNGSLEFYADSSQAVTLLYDSLLGNNNYLKGGNFVMHHNRFGNQPLSQTIIEAAHNIAGNVYLRAGSNISYGNMQYIAKATYPGGTTIQHTYYGPDTCFGNLKFTLYDNIALSTNGSGASYTSGNLTIDATGEKKWIEFAGGSGNSYTIDGNLVAQNFSPLSPAGVSISNLYLNNVSAHGTGDYGSFYCYSGAITNSQLAGNMQIIADSSQTYTIQQSDLRGSNNLLQSGSLDIHDSRFGQLHTGTSILRAAHNLAASVYMRDGNNIFYGDVNYEGYAGTPGGLTFQQTYYGPDTCYGNMHFVLDNNVALTTNGSGHSYVAGDLSIDAKNASKWVQFTGGNNISFTVDGNLLAQNFSPHPIPGISFTNLFIRNFSAKGTDSCGSFYCYTGDISNSSINGDIRIIGDSSQTFTVQQSTLSGNNMLIQSGNLEVHHSRLGQSGSGTCTLRAAHNLATSVLMRDGSNVFPGNVTYEGYAHMPGGLTFQQTYYGPDTCYGNMRFTLYDNVALTTNGNGQNYVAGNLDIDAQYASKWIQFTGGAGTGFTVDGSLRAHNFTPAPVAGISATNIFFRNFTSKGSDSVGSFYCYTGDINNSSFKGNLRIIGDSSQLFTILQSNLLGANNLIQAGVVEIQNSRFGQMQAGTTTINTALNVAGAAYARDGNNSWLGNLLWQLSAPASGALLWQQGFYGTDTCWGNMHITILPGSLASVNLAGSPLFLGSGLLLENNGTGNIAQTNSSTALHFIGEDSSQFEWTGTGAAPQLINIAMNRQGGLRLLSPLTCSGSLDLLNGVVIAATGRELKLNAGSTILHGNDSSYVTGPIWKTGNSAFEFPVGGNHHLAALRISAPAAATDVFSATYYPHPAYLDGYDSAALSAALHHLSRQEYWELNRINGNSTVKPALSWNRERSGIIDILPDLRLAHWDGNQWASLGDCTTDGNTSAGWLQAVNPMSSFSPITIASVSANNALPLVFIGFAAVLHNDGSVWLQWKTNADLKLIRSEVERSSNGRDWISIASIPWQIAGESSYIDRNPPGPVQYYRIHLIGSDAAASYSEIRMIKIANIGSIRVWPNPASDFVLVECPFESVYLQLLDIYGRVIWSNSISHKISSIPLAKLPAGDYIIQIRQGDQWQQIRFSKQ